MVLPNSRENCHSFKLNNNVGHAEYASTSPGVNQDQVYKRLDDRRFIGLEFLLKKAKYMR